MKFEQAAVILRERGHLPTPWLPSAEGKSTTVATFFCLRCQRSAIWLPASDDQGELYGSASHFACEPDTPWDWIGSA
jgi:hypothetical protein